MAWFRQRHAAPTGLASGFEIACYKHVAPLGLCLPVACAPAQYCPSQAAGQRRRIDRVLKVEDVIPASSEAHSVIFFRKTLDKSWRLSYCHRTVTKECLFMPCLVDSRQSSPLNRN